MKFLNIFHTDAGISLLKKPIHLKQYIQMKHLTICHVKNQFLWQLTVFQKNW